MSEKRRLIVAFTLSILFFSPAIVPAEKLVISFAAWPPYTMIKDGQASGIDVETARELCGRLGIEPKFREFPWKRALKYMKTGKVDALLTPRRTREREEFIYYPSEPMRIEKAVLLARKGSGIKATGLEELRGKRVGVVRGYAYAPELDSNQEIERIVCNDDEQLVRILAKGRVPLIAGAEEGSMRYLCKQAGFEIEVVCVLDGIPTYIGFSKKALGEKTRGLAEKFSKALRQLKEEGFIKKIESRYF